MPAPDPVSAAADVTATVPRKVHTPRAAVTNTAPPFRNADAPAADSAGRVTPALQFAYTPPPSPGLLTLAAVDCNVNRADSTAVHAPVRERRKTAPPEPWEALVSASVHAPASCTSLPASTNTPPPSPEVVELRTATPSTVTLPAASMCSAPPGVTESARVTFTFLTKTLAGSGSAG
jgi:hypothetical protein